MRESVPEQTLELSYGDVMYVVSKGQLEKVSLERLEVVGDEIHRLMKQDSLLTFTKRQQDMIVTAYGLIGGEIIRRQKNRLKGYYHLKNTVMSSAPKIERRKRFQLPFFGKKAKAQATA